MYQANRDEMRQFYFETFRKWKAAQPLTALESQITAVISMHPEYHKNLADHELTQGKEYLPEDGLSNPFLHMGLHLAIRDQISTNKPEGIQKHFRRLVTKLGSEHNAEHCLLEILGEFIWESQRSGTPPSDISYLEKIASM